MSLFSCFCRLSERQLCDKKVEQDERAIFLAETICMMVVPLTNVIRTTVVPISNIIQTTVVLIESVIHMTKKFYNLV